MAINFPTPATVGETYTDPVTGIVFTCNGTGWTQAGSGGGKAINDDLRARIEALEQPTPTIRGR